MQEDFDVRARLLLSVQMALVGAVPPALRAVLCSWEEHKIGLRFVFDGQIDPDDSEDMSVVGAEVIADFHSPWIINDQVERLDAPAKIVASPTEIWAYGRRERSGG
jgi:hypothetical protein